MNIINLNQDQQEALALVEDFVFNNKTHEALIIKGSAGTGKTTLIKAMMKAINRDQGLADLLHKRTGIVLAPTGRAARVLTEKLLPEFGAGTIHRQIYAIDRAEVFEEAINENDPGVRLHFPLIKESPNNTIFIVDESSMVGDTDNKGDDIQFGSGRLLKDLIEYARLGRIGREGTPNCKIIFVGDPAQLPPVGNGDLSPAMSVDYLNNQYAIQALEVELKQVMRQAEGSGILTAATQLRDNIMAKKFNRFDMPASADIVPCTISQAIEDYLQARKAKQTCVFISQSNAQVQLLNRTLRGRIWGEEGLPIQRNDILLVNRSSRLSSVSVKNDQGELVAYDGILPLTNGELVRVLDVGDQEKKVVNVRTKEGIVAVNLYFRHLTILVKGINQEWLYANTFIIENLLESKERELSALEVRALLVDFRQRNQKLKPNTADFTKSLIADPYFNALQVKYGYAMTCHKAQGGEWDNAFVEFGNVDRNESSFRWAYTAMTRAKKHLVTVGAPKFTPFNGVKFTNLDELVSSPMAQPQPIKTEGKSIIASVAITDHLKVADAPIVSLGSSLATTVIAPNNAADTSTALQIEQIEVSFVGQPKALYHYYQSITSACAEQGAIVVDVNHFQYMERYTLRLSDRMSWVDFRYKGNFMVTSITPTPGMPSDMALLEQLIPVIEQALVATPASSASAPESGFVGELLAQINTAIADSELKLVQHDSKPYRLRVYLVHGTDRFQLDFVYNSKDQLTSVTEVGGIGSSHGWLQRLMQRISQ